jgi:hypothetical protein
MRLPPAATGLAQSLRSRRSGVSIRRRKRPVSGVAPHEERPASSRYSVSRHSSAHPCNATMLLSVRSSEFIWSIIIHLAKKSPLLRQNSACSIWVGYTHTVGGCPKKMILGSGRLECSMRDRQVQKRRPNKVKLMNRVDFNSTRQFFEFPVLKAFLTSL